MNKITVIETYKNLHTYDLERFKQAQVSCFNGEVSYRRYKVTIELIEEPVEVLKQRLQALWEVSDNMHHAAALQNAAKEIGITLVGSRGAKRKRT